MHIQKGYDHELKVLLNALLQVRILEMRAWHGGLLRAEVAVFVVSQEVSN